MNWSGALASFHLAFGTDNYRFCDHRCCPSNRKFQNNTEKSIFCMQLQNKIAPWKDFGKFIILTLRNQWVEHIMIKTIEKVKLRDGEIKKQAGLGNRTPALPATGWVLSHYTIPAACNLWAGLCRWMGAWFIVLLIITNTGLKIRISFLHANINIQCTLQVDASRRRAPIRSLVTIILKNGN